MARYWVGGTGTWNSTAGTKWATTSGGAGGAAVPTAADDVFFDAASGAVTITTTAGVSVCRSLDCTGFTTGTLALANSATAISIGDGSGGACKFVSGMTINQSSSTTINFVATSDNSGTGWSITTGGVFMPFLVFNGAGGKWTLQDNLSFNTGYTLTLTAGHLDTNGKTVNMSGGFVSSNSNTRALTLGATAWNLTGGNWALGTATNMTLSAGTSVITMSGAAQQFQGGGLTYNSVQLTGSGTALVTGNNTFAILGRTGTAVKTDILSFSGDQTITSTFAPKGNSITNRLLVQSNVLGTTRTITLGASAICRTATALRSDFQDITMSGGAANERDLSAITGLSGDCGGNSGITFTSATTQTATGTASFTWSTHGWTSRVPLPQDTVSVPNAFSASQTITADMPRLGKDISFTCTGSPILSNAATVSLFGSLTLASGMTTSGSQVINLRGRSTQTLTTNGVTINHALAIQAPGGTYTLQDPLTVSRAIASSLSFSIGTFVDNGQTVSVAAAGTSGFSMTGGTLTKTGAWTFAADAAVTFWSVTGGTLTDSSSITLTATSTGTRVFAGGDQTYKTLTYTVAGSTGQLSITGSNTFNTINFSDVTNARTLAFTAATTTTVTNFNVNGTATKLMTVTSVTAATHTLTSSNRQSCDYLSIDHSIVDASPAWYAGANSTDGGSNTNWIFTAPPVGGKSLALLGVG